VARKGRPTILLLDDSPGAQGLLALRLKSSMNVFNLHPQKLKLSHLLQADVVLVDLALEEWKERDEQPLALQPRSGLALCALLRDHVEAEDSKSVKAFAIHSAKLPRYAVSPDAREHVFARLNALEWAFPKGIQQDRPPISLQISSLASAVRMLPRTWPTGGATRTKRVVSRLLRVPPDVRWVGRALRDIETCHPPTHELSELSHGIAFLRWVLHRILPYPCFLLDINYLAARLRVTKESLHRAIQKDATLRRLLKSVEYDGILADFLGRRWWRAGVEALLWSRTKGASFDSKAVRSGLASRPALLIPVNVDEPVVCLDASFQPFAHVGDAKNALRIQPDDWPPYADQAWTTKEAAEEHPSLRALVVDDSALSGKT
jgi:hypothetical protein